MTPILVLLFLHGMQSRYEGHLPQQIEAEVRQYAKARGYAFEVIPISGDYYQEQERQTRVRIAAGGVGAVYGFSAGGYTAARLRLDYPWIQYFVVGAPGVSGDIELDGVEHMDLPAALSRAGEIFDDHKQDDKRSAFKYQGRKAIDQSEFRKLMAGD